VSPVVLFNLISEAYISRIFDEITQRKPEKMVVAVIQLYQ